MKTHILEVHLVEGADIIDFNTYVPNGIQQMLVYPIVKTKLVNILIFIRLQVEWSQLW